MVNRGFVHELGQQVSTKKKSVVELQHIAISQPLHLNSVQTSYRLTEADQPSPLLHCSLRTSDSPVRFMM